MRLPDRMPVHLSDLIPPYFSTYDAEQAFLVRIKDARSGIPGLRVVADDRLKLGWQTRREQIGRNNVRSRRTLPVGDDDFLANPWGILTQRHAA